MMRIASSVVLQNFDGLHTTLSVLRVTAVKVFSVQARPDTSVDRVGT
jgi:hypothetical protein